MSESKYQMPPCADKCIFSCEDCISESCRYWIDYEQDHNCSLISIYKNGAMTLNEISKRMNLSIVRISQIEKLASKKISKRIKRWLFYIQKLFILYIIIHLSFLYKKKEKKSKWVIEKYFRRTRFADLWS